MNSPNDNRQDEIIRTAYDILLSIDTVLRWLESEQLPDPKQLKKEKFRFPSFISFFQQLQDRNLKKHLEEIRTTGLNALSERKGREYTLADLRTILE